MPDLSTSPLAFVARGPDPMLGSDNGPPDAIKLEAIRRLLDVTHTLEHARSLSRAAARHVAGSLRLEGARRDEALPLLEQEADAVFGADLARIERALVPLYHRYFSLEEIEAMIEFNRSPLGRKLLRVMPLVMGDVARATESWARDLVPVFYRRALERMRTEPAES